MKLDKKTKGLEVGFPGGSHGRKSACNAGDQDLIPGYLVDIPLNF